VVGDSSTEDEESESPEASPKKHQPQTPTSDKKELPISITRSQTRAKSTTNTQANHHHNNNQQRNKRLAQNRSTLKKTHKENTKHQIRIELLSDCLKTKLVLMLWLL